MMVARSLEYLAAARYGLTEDELLDVLSDDCQVWDDFDRRAHYNPPEHRLPVIVLSRLLFDLQPCLNERMAPGGVAFAFYHRQLTECVTARYLDGEEPRCRHSVVAGHFRRQPAWLDAARTRPNARRAAELIPQLLGAREYDEAIRSLTDLDFLSAVCAAGLVFVLQSDYLAALSSLPEYQEELAREHEHEERMRTWVREIIAYCDPDRARPEGAVPPVPRSVQPWSGERLQAECCRMLEAPTRLDVLCSFARFVQQEFHSLEAFGSHPAFVIQHACNYAPAGPVHAAAEAKLPPRSPVFLRRWSPDASYNPRPALLRTLEAGIGDPQSVQITADGSRAVSGHDDGIRVWDLATGACLRKLGEGSHEGREVTALSITPGGHLAASASADGLLRLWELPTGACLRTLDGRATPVDALALRQDGLRLLEAAVDALAVWDPLAGACVHTLPLQTAVDEGGYQRGLAGLVITPEARYALAGSGDGMLQLWDLATPACLWKHQTGVPVTGVALAMDGKTAFSAHEDGRLRVWNAATGACWRVLDTGEPAGASLCATADGRLALTAGAALRLWDLETGACIRALEGYTDGVSRISMTPDGRRAVSVGADRKLHLWDLETGGGSPAREKHRGAVVELNLVPAAGSAVSLGEDQTLRFWDLETGACRRVIAGEFGFAQFLEITAEGKMALSSGEEASSRLWDLEAGACRRELESPLSRLLPRANRLLSVSGHQGLTLSSLPGDDLLHVLLPCARDITALAVASDERTAVSAQRGSLRVWDLAAGRCRLSIEATPAAISELQITPDGSRALAAGADRLARVWDLETGRCVCRLEELERVSLSPAGDRAISWGADQQLRIWDLDRGVCLGAHQCRYYDEYWRWVFTDDGRRAVTLGTRDSRVWDLESGRCTHLLPVWSLVLVRMLPDHRRMVSADMDRGLRLWDLETGACLALARTPSLCRSMELVGSRRLITGDDAGDVLLYDLPA